MKNRVIIACRTLEREIQAAMKETGNSCLVYYLPLKYHVAPKEMAVELQRIIDSLSNVDEVLVCVSGCGGSTKDLKATTADIIIPKTRDCIDILLSNQESYCSPACCLLYLRASFLYTVSSWFIT